MGKRWDNFKKAIAWSKDEKLHYRKLEVLDKEVEKMAYGNRKKFIIEFSAFRIMLGLFLISIVIGSAYIIVNWSNNITKAVTEYPELSLLAKYGDRTNTDEFLILAGSYILRNNKLEADASFDFQSYFTTTTERYLEKKDLTCVDEYEYFIYDGDEYRLYNGTTFVNSYIWEESIDKGCKNYKQSGSIYYFKCPKRNCKMIEKTIVHQGEWIPTKFNANKININKK